MQHVLWGAHDLRTFSFLRNIVMLCYEDSPEDITNGLLKIASCFRQRNNSTNVLICGILSCEDTSSVNRLLIKETNNISKTSFSVYHINFIHQDTN